MFSYIKTIQDVVPPEIYGRGIKYFLEKRVLKKQNLLLDYWRLYEVSGRHYAYQVKMPLLHLALSPSEFAKASQALMEVVSCTCPYFNQYEAFCKHIVAVCVALEEEFGVKVSQPAIPSTSVLDEIFSAQQTKQLRVYQDKLEQYLNTSYSTSISWFYEIVRENNKQPEVFAPFIVYFKQKVMNALKRYEQEKKIIFLALESLKSDSLFWWEFWESLLPNFTQKNLNYLLTEVFKLYTIGLTSKYQNQFQAVLINLDQTYKDEILLNLQETFVIQKQIWLQFVFFTKNAHWLADNLSLLDSQTLLKAIAIIPELAEDIEIKIAGEVRVWSDFLQNAQYGELVELMLAWKKTLGPTDLYEQTIKYIKLNHSKKRSLITGLNRI